MPLRRKQLRLISGLRSHGRAAIDSAAVLGAPTNLSAGLPSDSVVNLVWTASAGALSYSVYRSTTSGAEVLFARNIVATNYDDTTAVNLTTYYYKISATNYAGEGPLTSEVSQTPIGG